MPAEAAGWPDSGEVAPERMRATWPPGARGRRPAPDAPGTAGGDRPCRFLRGRARARAGGLDAASYASWYAALIDLSLRMAGLGWRNALCETAFVARGGEGGPADGDLEALAARWPGWRPRLAEFLMHDPLRAARDELGRRLAGLEPPSQRELFAP